MFDKLVVSEPEGADFKNRRRYFLTSSLIVGVLFLAAVVASIFAADFSLGNNGFELAQIISPPELSNIEPETPQPPRENNQSQTTNDLPRRTANIPRIDESPTAVPTTTSTTQNTEATRPIGPFIPNASFNSDPVGGTPSGREPSEGGGKSGLGGLARSTSVEPTEDTQTPPREIKKPKPPIVSKGVLNGYAKSLPKPAYSAAARAVQAKGKVIVQVTIDERGNVVSATAIDGHPMLRGDAERAARNAKFSPTLLSEVPVKVTGVITYNFIL